MEDVFDGKKTRGTMSCVSVFLNLFPASSAPKS
jgi:hypothetical protein